MKILRIKDSFRNSFKENVENGTNAQIECQGINGLLDVSILEKVEKLDNAYIVSVNGGIELEYNYKDGFSKLGITTFRKTDGSKVEQNAVLGLLMFGNEKLLCNYGNNTYTITMENTKIYLTNNENYLVYYAE